MATRHRRAVVFAGAGVLLVATAVATLCLGRPLISPFAISAVIRDPSSLAHVVLMEVRLPRLVAGMLVGTAFAVAGLILQQAMRNPLAVPEVLGISSGAALAAATIVVWGLPVPLSQVSVWTLAGGLVAAGVTLLAARTRRTADGVLLVGFAVSAGTTALMLAVMSLASNLEYQALFRYLNGSLAGVGWAQLTPVLPWLIPAIPLVVLAMPAVELLRTGDTVARSVGARPAAMRLGLIAIVCVMLAPLIAVTGPVGWIGFLVPLLAGRLLRADRVVWLVGACVLLGALAVVAADLLARLAFYPIETPVGGWTALASVVLGVALLARRHRTPA